jgi:hypothetical protein
MIPSSVSFARRTGITTDRVHSFSRARDTLKYMKFIAEQFEVLVRSGTNYFNK